MIDAILKGLSKKSAKGSRAAAASLGGRRSLQGPFPSSLRNDVVSTTAKTTEEAILEGTNKYIGKDGQQRIIRNYDSNNAPKGNTARADNRDVTRGTTKRSQRADVQTIGKSDFKHGSTVRAPHHRLGIAQMTPAFEGLNRAQASELVTKVQKKYNTALGNRSGNRYDLPDEVHDAYHGWERKHDTGLSSMQGMSVDERVETLGVYFDTMARAGDEVIFHLMRNKDKGREILAQIANNL